MCCACGMDYEGLCITDICQERKKLEFVDKGKSGVIAASDTEAEDCTEEAATEGPFSQGVVFMAWKSGIVDPCYIGVLLEKLGDTLRIGAVTLHPDMKRFDSLKEQEGVKRGEAHSLVSESFDAGFDSEGNISQAREVSKHLPEFHSVVAGIGFCETRVSALAPVEVASIDHDASDRGSVASHELGEGVGDDGRSEF